MKSDVHVIAEAGTNHWGDVGRARLLVDLARDAGADSVKFQIIYPEGLYLERVREGDALVDNEVFGIRAASMLSDDEWREVAAYAAELGVPFTASVFDERGIALLEEFDPRYIKVASCDLNNGPLLRRVAATGRRVVVATGMSTLAEIETAVGHVTGEGNDDLVLLHCVSVYPAPTPIMNLGFLRDLAGFGFPIGLSDHSESNVAAIAAVALGATWFEKHLTYDRGAEGFDHAYAMEPAGLTAYVADIRDAEAALRPADPKVGEAEAAVRARARRSLYAARDLAVGEVLTADDVLVVRPEATLVPDDVDRVVGATVAVAVPAASALTWDALA